MELGVIALLVLVFLQMWSWPYVIADESLDGSWQLILTHAVNNGLRFGEEVVFTYGPLGSLSSFSYSGYNHAGKYAFELFMRISMVYFLLRFLPHLTPYLRYGCLFVYLLTLQIVLDVYETYYFFGMLSWAAAVLLDRRKKAPMWMLLSVGLVFILICSLVKFTLLVAGLFCLLLVGGSLACQKRPGQAALLLAGFPAGFLLLWWLLGQRAGDLPEYFLRSYQVAKGYAMSMQLATDPRVFRFFLLFIAGSLAMLVVLFKDQLRQKRKVNRLGQPGLALALLLAGFLFMTWKQGAVRSDGHIWQFFGFVPFAAWFAYPLVKKRAAQLSYAALLVLKPLLLVYAVEVHFPGFVASIPERVWKNTALGINGILKPSASLNDLRDKLTERGETLLRKEPLLAAIGDRTVDMAGDHQGLVILPGLHYKPRPIFQNYVANNAFLQDLNGRYWKEGNTPEAVLQSLDAIDGTLPTLSDSQTINHLLTHYQLEAAKGTKVVLGKKPAPSAVVRGKEEEYDLSFGDAREIEHTGEPVFARMVLKLNFFGRLRAFFYKPPILRMKFELADGSFRDYRINPVTAEREFLLAPGLVNAPQLWEHRMGGPAPKISRVTLHGEAGAGLYFRKDLRLFLSPVRWED